MQWLINLIAEKVIDTIGIPPCYIDRGDPADFDFQIWDFTRDGLWHDLDVSGVVPAGAVAVLLKLQVRSSAIPKFIYFRENGNVNPYNVSFVATQVANNYIGGDLIIALDTERKIEYLVTAVAWNNINATVSGWFL